MLPMPSIPETARSLISSRDLTTATLQHSRTIQGCPISFAYTEQIQSAGYNDPIPEVILESSQTLEQLFSPSEIPSAWLPIIREIGVNRVKKHCNEPVDLAFSLKLFINGNLPRAETFKLPLIPQDTQSNLPDFRNKQLLINAMNAIMKIPKLRRAFINEVSIQQGDVFGGYRMNKDPVITALSEFGLLDTQIVELGCGMGLSTKEWSGYLPEIIGSDRQYYPTWYNPQWQNRSKCMRFMQIDFTDTALPFAENTIGAFILEYVLSSVDENGIQHLSEEAYRTLLPGGLLISGPHWVEDKGKIWRIFQKSGMGFEEIPGSSD